MESANLQIHDSLDRVNFLVGQSESNAHLPND